jgi:hypothetical protein
MLNALKYILPSCFPQIYVMNFLHKFILSHGCVLHYLKTSGLLECYTVSTTDDPNYFGAFRQGQAVQMTSMFVVTLRYDYLLSRSVTDMSVNRILHQHQEKFTRDYTQYIRRNLRKKYSSVFPYICHD